MGPIVFISPSFTVLVESGSTVGFGLETKNRAVDCAKNPELCTGGLTQTKPLNPDSPADPSDPIGPSGEPDESGGADGGKDQGGKTETTQSYGQNSVSFKAIKAVWDDFKSIEKLTYGYWVKDDDKWRKVDKPEAEMKALKTYINNLAKEYKLKY